MTQAQLSRIYDITAMNPLAFERELSQISDPFLALPLLVQILSSSLSNQQKQTAASGINLIHRTAFQKEYKQWHRWWRQFQERVLFQAGTIQWQHLSILSKSAQALMDEFGEEFCLILNPLFEKLNFKAKLLLYDSFLYTQLTSETMFIFLRETVEEFLRDALGFLCWIHDRGDITPENLQIEKDTIHTLQLLLSNLQSRYKDPYADQLMQALSLNYEVFSIILEELLFDPSKSEYVSILKKQFSPERLSELILISQAKQPALLEVISQNKAGAMRIFTTILGRFDKKSMVEQFDHFKQLHLMEKMAPIVIEQLIQLTKGSRIQEMIEVGVVALIDWLGEAAKFNFQLQFFEERYQELLFLICYPLLAPSLQEIESFKDDGQLFIRITQEMVQNPQNKVSSPQNSASILLQRIVQVLNGSLTSLVDLNVRAIRCLLTGDSDRSFSVIKENFGLELSLEAAFTVLSIFSDQYGQRADLVQNIKKGILDLPQMQKLSGLSQAKFLLFLSYNYQTIYQHREEQAGRFLSKAAGYLDRESTLGDCALQLFENCIGLGFQKDIWTLMLQKIVSSQSSYLLQIVEKIVADKIQSLGSGLVQDLIEKIILRLISEYKICQEQSKGTCVQGSKSLLKCLNLLQQISSHTSYLQKEQSLIDSLWPVFDMFEFGGQIEFEDNVLAIFRRVIVGSNRLASRHYSFVGILPDICKRLADFNPQLERIFTELLVRGREHFVLEGNHADLEKTLRCLKECYNENNQQKALRHICILYQFAYSEYTDVLRKDEQLLQSLFKVYQDKKNSLCDETIAAIINLFITQEIYYGNSRHAIIKQNNICIFRDYQAKIAAQGFRKLIQKYYCQDSVIDYLRYSIRLLHFLKSTSQPQQRNTHEKCNYYSLPFPGLETLDPFEETCKVLNFLKDRLPAGRYDSLIDSLNEQISLGEVRDLLTKRIVMRSLRTYVRVKDPRHD